MPLAVMHVLTSIILVDLYRDYIAKKKKYFTLNTIFFAGFFGLLPDIDIPLRMISEALGFNVPFIFQHGGITHTPFFALLFLMPAFIFYKKKKHKIAMYFYVATFAIFLHIFLDYIIGGGSYEGIMWLFPVSLQVWKIHIINYFSFSHIPESIDALLLLAWLWHEEIKHKISDFI